MDDVPVPCKITVLDQQGKPGRTARTMCTQGPEARMSELFSASLSARLDVQSLVEMTLRFSDPEGDLITISSDRELREALALVKAQSIPLLDLFLSPKTSITAAQEEPDTQTSHETTTPEDSPPTSESDASAHDPNPKQNDVSLHAATPIVTGANRSDAGKTLTPRTPSWDQKVNSPPSWIPAETTASPPQIFSVHTKIVEALRRSNPTCEIAGRLELAMQTMLQPALELDKALNAARAALLSRDPSRSPKPSPTLQGTPSPSSSLSRGGSATLTSLTLAPRALSSECATCDSLRRELERERARRREAEALLREATQERRSE